MSRLKDRKYITKKVVRQHFLLNKPKRLHTKLGTRELTNKDYFDAGRMTGRNEGYYQGFGEILRLFKK